MLSRLKYYFIYPIMCLFVLSAKKSRNYQLVYEDLESYNNRWKKSYSLGLLLYKDIYFRSIFYNRIRDVKICNFLKRILRPSSSLCIPDTLDLGGGVHWSHPTSTYLNAKKIGKNFSFRQNTTIENKIDGRNDLVPIIGDNVFVGANVCIIGDIVIGNNVVIGAGSVVTKNIPDNVTVVGNPIRVLYNKNNYGTK